MDQSTQVNFPIVNLRKKMRRHNTSIDFYQANKGQLSHSWTNIKTNGIRPKSLNFPSESLKSKPFYHSDTPIARLNIPSNETSLGSISRERTPPFSCNSSITSTSCSGNKNYAVPNRTQDDESSPKTCCKCYEMGSCRRSLKSTTEGLSWRRLHMSRAKLKATSTTSELLSGFAMIAMVELQINKPTGVPEWLFVMFAICTTVLVAVHIFALMISTYILPNIDAIAKLEVCEMVSESPHERMRWFIELAWASSTILGLFLFLVEVAILCWVKFWDYSFPAAIAATVIVIPVLITFVLFAVHFYHSLVVFKYNASVGDMQQLEDMKKRLDQVSNPV